MNAQEHYAESERFARRADDFAGEPSPRHLQAARLAQVHATLAVAAMLEPTTVTMAVQSGEDFGAAKFLGGRRS